MANKHRKRAQEQRPDFRCHPAYALWVLAIVTSAAATGCHHFPSTGASQGVVLYQQGQYQSALPVFQQAVASQPQSSDAYYNLASTYHRLGTQRSDKAMLAQAEQLYNQSLDIDDQHRRAGTGGDNPDCYRGLAVLLCETDRADKAFTLLKNWSQSNPRSADAHVELARLYQEFGDSDTANNQLQQALRLDQYNARAWAALGYLREQSGDPNQALVNYQRALQLNRSMPAVAERVAVLQRQPGAGGVPATGTMPTGMPPGMLPPIPASPTTIASQPPVPGAPAAAPPRTVQTPTAPPRY